MRLDGLLTVLQANIGDLPLGPPPMGRMVSLSVVRASDVVSG